LSFLQFINTPGRLSPSYDCAGLPVLPLPLFHFSHKYTAVKLIKQAMGDVLRECPGCEQTVEVIRPNEYNCVQCECGIVWCIDCKKEPHWPMTCEIAAEWRRRWKHRSEFTENPSYFCAIHLVYLISPLSGRNNEWVC
ncbi:hypothetical protein COOONC_18018, partial [Cooperia oncophora]